MPGAIQLLSKATGIPVDMMDEWLKKGGAISKDVLPKLAEEMGKVADESGVLDKYLKSSLASQNKMKNVFDKMLMKMFQGGVDQGLAKLFILLTKAMQIMTPVALHLSQMFTAMFIPLEGLYKLFQVIPEWATATTIAFAGLAAALKVGAWSWLKNHPLYVFFALMALVLEDIWVWQQNGNSVFGELFGGFDQVSDKLEPFFKKWDDWYLKVKEILVGLGFIKESAPTGMVANPDKVNPYTSGTLRADKTFNDVSNFLGGNALSKLVAAPIAFGAGAIQMAGDAITNPFVEDYLPSLATTANNISSIPAPPGMGGTTLKVDKLYINNPVGNFDEVAKEVMTAFPTSKVPK